MSALNLTMDVMKTTPIAVQNNYFTGANKPVNACMHEKVTTMQAQTTIRNLTPVYFHPSFTAKNPQVALYRAEKLKEFYAKKGFTYLLPHEVWSDKKILDTIKLLGREVDKLAESKKLNKKTLQKTIDQFIPKCIKGKIIIKDFNDLKKDLRKLGDSENEIKKLFGRNALAINEPNVSTLYFEFRKATQCKYKSIDLKSDIEHEIKHALTARLQNATTTNMYRNEYGVCVKQNKIFNKIFSVFERRYNPMPLTRQIETTQENMLSWLKVDSIEALYESFEKTLSKLIEDGKAIGEFKIGFEKKKMKQFFADLKYRAKDEKEAYQSEKRYRENYRDLNTPTSRELRPLLYAEMEKFFAKKEADCRKQV